jgi:hypothetical protein
MSLECMTCNECKNFDISTFRQIRVAGARENAKLLGGHFDPDWYILVEDGIPISLYGVPLGPVFSFISR